MTEFGPYSVVGSTPTPGIKEGVIMLEKIGFYSLLSLIAIVWIWVMFVVTPVMIETAMSALEMWKEIL